MLGAAAHTHDEAHSSHDCVLCHAQDTAAVSVDLDATTALGGGTRLLALTPDANELESPRLLPAPRGPPSVS